jgi:NADH-quinone oxidoreductase subunit D
VLRIICILCGEVVSLISPEIGLLHRGSEKLIECNYWSSSIPYFDRFDYVSTITQEHLFSYTVERMINSFIVMYVSSLRCLFMEYYRIMNHTLAITTHAIDIGIITLMLWIFEEREKFLVMVEICTGSRFHTMLILVSRLRYDIHLY